MEVLRIRSLDNSLFFVRSSFFLSFSLFLLKNCLIRGFIPLSLFLFLTFSFSCILNRVKFSEDDLMIRVDSVDYIDTLLRLLKDDKISPRSLKIVGAQEAYLLAEFVFFLFFCFFCLFLN